MAEQKGIAEVACPQPQDEVLEAPVAMAIDQVMSRFTEVSTLPHIATRVIKVANDPSTGAADLRAIVESDPALSSRIVKCVNSAAYALRFRINNLQRAISYLGFKQVRNLAITASVSELFKSNDPIGPYRRNGLWRHMVSVAVCSRMIAARQKFPMFEEAFLAGLLHDLGIILEDQYCHDGFVKILDAVARPDPSQEGTPPLVQAEQRVLGFDHTLLGKRLAMQWRFPPEVCDAIRFHHHYGNYRGEHGAILACVVLANMICTLKGISAVGVRLLTPAVQAVEDLKLTKEDVKVLVDDLDHELKLHKALFKI